MLTKIKLSKLLAFTVCCFVALSAIAIGAIAARTLFQEVADRALAMQDISLRTSATLIERAIPNAKVEWNIQRITIPDLAEFSNNKLVDDVSRTTGGEATIFSYNKEKDEFFRVATSIKTADGSRAIGTALGRSGPVFPVVMRGGIYRGEAEILGLPYYTIYQPFYNADGSVSGIIFGGVRKDVVAAATNAFVMTMSATILALVTVLTIAAFLVARWMVRFVEPITEAIGKVAADEDVAIPCTNFQNEIGDIARAIAILSKKMRQRRSLEASQQSETRERIARSERTETLVNDFRQQVGLALSDVGSVMHQMTEASKQLEQAANTSEEQSTAAASAAGRTAGGVGAVVAATEQLAASIREIAARATQTSGIVATATHRVNEVDADARKLAASAQKIGEVVNLIRSIAAQTNLLALNATIEAARAGDAGRGFSVVAAEVKTLSLQTAKATDEISSQIEQIQSATTNAVDGIDAVAQIMSEASGTAAAIAAAVEEQDAATQEISRSVQDASNGVVAVTRNVDELHGEIGQVSGIAHTVARASDQVESERRRLQHTVEQFLVNVAAA